MKNLVFFFFSLFLFLNAKSQFLTKNMTFEDVRNIYGKPDKIDTSGSFSVTPDNKFTTWYYGEDTIVRFLKSTLDFYHYSFKNIYEKRIPSIAKNDSLKNCSLNIFLYNTQKNSVVNSIPGTGDIIVKTVENLEIRAYFKTPKSYQIVDSIEWFYIIDLKGFRIICRNYGSDFKNQTIKHIEESKIPNKFYIYVSKIILKNGQIIEFPLMKNEKFIIWTNSYKNYFIYVTMLDALRKIKLLKVDYHTENESLLIFNLK